MKLRDLIYKYIRLPYYNIRFLQKHKYPYCPWDVYDSSVEILFAQFRDFYESHYDSHFSKEWLETLKKDYKTYEKWGWDKKSVKPFKDMYKRDKKALKQLSDIYKYITVSRKQNQQIFEDILSTMFEEAKDPKNTWEEILGKPRNLIIRYSFNKEGLAIVKETKAEKHNMSFFNFEVALNKKDIEFAKKILDLRQYLCD